MNVFGKVTDIVIAFICMFLAPLLYFQNAEQELCTRRAENAAEYFLECVENNGAVTDELCRQLYDENYACTGNICFEIEISRYQPLPSTFGGETHVTFSDKEIHELLQKSKSLPLKSSDCVRVYVYGSYGSGRRVLLGKMERYL